MDSEAEILDHWPRAAVMGCDDRAGGFKVATLHLVAPIQLRLGSVFAAPGPYGAVALGCDVISVGERSGAQWYGAGFWFYGCAMSLGN